MKPSPIVDLKTMIAIYQAMLRDESVTAEELELVRVYLVAQISEAGIQALEVVTLAEKDES